MRYDDNHKERTRARVLAEAAAAIRSKGAGRVGVAEVMAGAGLTHGGFYAHFESKDQLGAEACAAATDSAIARFFSKKSPQSGLKGRVAQYLSPAHRDDPSAGCPVAALGSEIARCDEKTRAAATQTFLELVNIIAAESGKTRPDVARRRAWVAAATMIGALTMSRIVTDSELSASILREARKQLVERHLTKYRRLRSRQSGADKLADA